MMYHHGTTVCRLKEILPPSVTNVLREEFRTRFKGDFELMRIKFLKPIVAINVNIAMSIGTDSSAEDTLGLTEDGDPKVFIGCDEAGIYKSLYRQFNAEESITIADYRIDNKSLKFTAHQSILKPTVSTDRIDKTTYEIENISDADFVLIEDEPWTKKKQLTMTYTEAIISNIAGRKSVLRSRIDT